MVIKRVDHIDDCKRLRFDGMHVHHRHCNYTCFWFPVENREEPIKSVLCVCVSGVCATRIISETAPRIFPKPGMKLGVKNVRNVARPLF